MHIAQAWVEALGVPWLWVAGNRLAESRRHRVRQTADALGWCMQLVQEVEQLGAVMLRRLRLAGKACGFPLVSNTMISQTLEIP